MSESSLVVGLLVMAAPLALGLVVLAATGSGKKAPVPLAKRRGPKERTDFVMGYAFPEVAKAVLERERPDLSPKLRDAAWEALREYFALHAHKPGRFLGMPSETADAAWHAFILCEREYARFCEEAFGARLEHVPDPACRAKALDGSFKPKADVVASWEAAKELRAARPELGLAAASALFVLDAEAGSGWIHGKESLDALEAAARAKGDRKDSGDSGGSCGSSSSWSTGSSCGAASPACSDGGGSCSDGGAGSSCSSGSSCGGGCGG